MIKDWSTAFCCIVIIDSSASAFCVCQFIISNVNNATCCFRKDKFHDAEHMLMLAQAEKIRLLTEQVSDHTVSVQIADLYAAES